jgi:Ser/Thr protein kinase RdoA (MazF antagonist)
VDEELRGGNMNSVRRVGDTVVRIAGPWTPTVHRYLSRLADAGVDWVPRPIAIDGDNEILSFLHGEVPEYPLPEWVWTDSALADAGRHLRELHDASVGFGTPDDQWQSPTREPVEVICHNDFAPHNLAFRDGRVVGAIDFDMSSPGPRVWDLAYLATRMVPLTSERHDGAVREDQWPRRIRLMLDAYGGGVSEDFLVRVAIDRLRDLAEFSRRRAAQLEKTVLLDHAALYDRDAIYLEDWLASSR